MPTRYTRGFTIVELLVVIAIMGVLMALLLPAVQSARESGRKTYCMNNLYQLGMGVNRYDQDAGRIPSWSNTLGGTSVSWPVMLLPYIERNDLFEVWSAGPGTVVQINGFLCPSAQTENNLGPLAYAGNCGDGTNLANSKYNGVMPFPGVKYSLGDVSDGDGVSTTLLFAEKAGSGFQANWGLNAGAVPPAFSTFGFQQNNTNSQNQLPSFGISTTLPNYGPSSQHSRGTTTAFCDGHTKFIASNLDAAVYAQLVTSRNSKATQAAYQAAPINESQY